MGAEQQTGKGTNIQRIGLWKMALLFVINENNFILPNILKNWVLQKKSL